MERLNFIMNLLIICYIIIKDAKQIKKSIIKFANTCNEYYMAIRKQLIVKLAEDIPTRVEFDEEEFNERCYAVGKGEINFDTYSFYGQEEEIPVTDTNGLSEEDAESLDFLLASCIAVGADNHEEIVDFDLRGDSAAPLDFSNFGGSREQHYDLEVIKALAGERRDTASYYAFEQTVDKLKRQGKVSHSYVMVAKVTKGQILAALNGQPVVFDDDIFNEREKDSLIEPDSVVIDVETNTNADEVVEIKEDPQDMPKPSISEEEFREGVEAGYEAYCSINILIQAANAMISHVKDINKQYDEMQEANKAKEEIKIKKSNNEIDSILAAISNSRFAVINNLPVTIDELINEDLAERGGFN